MADKLGIEKTWVANVVLYFLLFSLQITMADRGSSNKKLEVEKLLKKLNKPAVKSIESPDGDIIDCVHILNQPAFDHPKLKNHKIQMRPNFHPKGRIIQDENKVASKSKHVGQLWHQSGSCPEGTIPMRRTTKDDILRVSSIQQFGKKNSKSIPDLFGSLYSTQGHEYAIAYVDGEKYYGAKAFINVWKPNVQQPTEFSLSQIWILNRADPNNVETIEAGWQIYSQFYGDNNTRLFIYWTNDSYRGNGCTNLLCSGFVQVDKEIVLGGSIQPLSVYGDAGSQHEIRILIWKDPESGNWWMTYGENNKHVGYWPSSLFSHLSESASVVQWGGEIINWRSDGGQHTTTQMGSGHFPNAGFGKASFFRDIQIVDAHNTLVPPNNLRASIDNSKCYDAILNGYSENWGAHFFYGGPGRNPGCP